jgi:hypothetical protein
VWGAIVAQVSPTVVYLAGGVTGVQGPVSTALVRFEQTDAGANVKTVSTQISPRYCGCAMADEAHRELVVIGGRDDSFNEVATAEIVNLDTGAVTPLDAGDAMKHPVGCHAVFLADRGEGYVFGGADSAGFTGTTWRYTPSDHHFTALNGQGPPARYDGAMRYPKAGGAVWLVAGMGGGVGNVHFYADIWKFDPAAATWSQVPATGAAPPGRRYPWVAFADDLGTLAMGFGTTTPTGTTMIGDLWRFDVAKGTWTSIPRTAAAQPAARGFSPWLPGPQGSAGLLSGGLEDRGAAKQALVLQPPVPGAWR